MNFLVGNFMNSSMSGIANYNSRICQISKFKLTNIYDKELLKIRNQKVVLSFKIHEIENLKVFSYIFNKIRRNNNKITFIIHEIKNLKEEIIFYLNCDEIIALNDLILAKLKKYKKKINLKLGYTPSLIQENKIYLPSSKKINLFSFGMMHKSELKDYKKLKDVLELSKINYQIYLSTAFHQSQNKSNELNKLNYLKKIFGIKLIYCGFMSDELIISFLKKCDYFVSFYEGGFKSNNTSMITALHSKIISITNLTKYSPKFIKHNENLYDINQLKYQDLSKKNLKLTKKKFYFNNQKYLKNKTFKNFVDEFLN